MYRINVYPEYERKRRDRRSSHVHGTLLGLLFGACLLLIGGLMLSAHLLQVRAEALRASTLRLTTLVETTAAARPEIQTAQSLLRLRKGRIDWSPKLAAVADQIGPTIQLTRVDGQFQTKGTPAVLRLTGAVAERTTQLEHISQFMTALAEDRRIAQELPSVQLGNLKGSEDGRFVITCTAGEGGS